MSVCQESLKVLVDHWLKMKIVETNRKISQCLNHKECAAKRNKQMTEMFRKLVGDSKMIPSPGFLRPPYPGAPAQNIAMPVGVRRGVRRPVGVPRPVPRPVRAGGRVGGERRVEEPVGLTGEAPRGIQRPNPVRPQQGWLEMRLPPSPQERQPALLEVQECDGPDCPQDPRRQRSLFRGPTTGTTGQMTLTENAPLPVSEGPQIPPENIHREGQQVRLEDAGREYVFTYMTPAQTNTDTGYWSKTLDRKKPDQSYRGRRAWEASTDIRDLFRQDNKPY